MPLSKKDVASIASYTRIGLTDEQLDAMTVDLNNIIESLAPITHYDLEGVEPTFHPIGDLSNVMRDDVARAGFPRDIALGCASSVEDGFFKIPTILGGGDA